MIPLLLLLSNEAHASRKADVIRRLNLQDRLEEGQQYCEKWQASTPDASQDLRERCAEVFFRVTEGKSSSKWEDFRERWAGTQAAENARDPLVEALITEIGENGSQSDYQRMIELASNDELKEKCRGLALKSALIGVKTPEEAKALALEMPDREEILSLAERYPDAFFSIEIDDRTVTVTVDPPLPMATPEPKWGMRCPEQEPVLWDKTVRDDLRKAGIPNSHIMKRIQDHLGNGPAFPLCPLYSQPPSCEPGILLEFNGYKAFKAVDWDKGCLKSPPVLMTFTKKRLRSLSLAPGHLVNLKDKSQGNTRSFVKLKKIAYLSEDMIYMPYKSSFLVYPIDGSPPFLSEKPPGVWKIKMGKKVKGDKKPKSWKVKKTKTKLNVSTTKMPQWDLPKGNLRIFSPLAADVLGLKGIIPQNFVPLSVNWRSTRRGMLPPKRVKNIRVSKMDISEIQTASYQIFATGFKSSQLEVFDGWYVNLDEDDDDETVLRLVIDEQEAVAILDKDEVFGPRTYFFKTDHASQRGKRGPTPKAFFLEGDGDKSIPIFYWSGSLGREKYVEWIHPQGSGYHMLHD